MRPIFYSFRRCPYAIRARLALHYSGVSVALREIELRNKPEPMLMASPKGTVPVLVLPEGEVLEESEDIMRWAVSFNDPEQWLVGVFTAETRSLIDENDFVFKKHLDRYKYADRYPEHSQDYYRAQGEEFLKKLNQRLQRTQHLLADQASLVDFAILPFIRQFAFVDKVWFDAAPYPDLQAWLARFLQSDLFARVMFKYPAWQTGDEISVFPV